MSIRTNPWANARIIIKNTYSGTTILDTEIQDSDYTSGWIWVTASNYILDVGEKVEALIISSNTLQECSCTVRSIMSGGQIQLTVFKKNEKADEREQERYEVNLPAVVRRITEENKNEPKTGNVFLVTIRNMSSSGILFRAPKNQFALNDQFVFEAKFNKRLLTIEGKVVRIQNTGNDVLNEECGALIQSVKYS